MPEHLDEISKDLLHRYMRRSVEQMSKMHDMGTSEEGMKNTKTLGKRIKGQGYVLRKKERELAKEETLNEGKDDYTYHKVDLGRGHTEGHHNAFIKKMEGKGWKVHSRPVRMTPKEDGVDYHGITIMHHPDGRRAKIETGVLVGHHATYAVPKPKAHSEPAGPKTVFFTARGGHQVGDVVKHHQHGKVKVSKVEDLGKGVKRIWGHIHENRLEELSMQVMDRYFDKAAQNRMHADKKDDHRTLGKRDKGLGLAFKKQHLKKEEALEEAREPKPWAGMPSGAADVTKGTHAHFTEKHGRAPSKSELAAALKERAEKDAVGWHAKHAAVAHKHLTKEEVLVEGADAYCSNCGENLGKKTEVQANNPKLHCGTCGHHIGKKEPKKPKACKDILKKNEIYEHPNGRTYIVDGSDEHHYHSSDASKKYGATEYHSKEAIHKHLGVIRLHRNDHWKQPSTGKIFSIRSHHPDHYKVLDDNGNSFKLSKDIAHAHLKKD